jgi:hypothetical protein
MSNGEPQQTEQLKYPTVYVGPNSAKLGLVRFAQYTEFNDDVKAAIKKIPALAILLIPLEQFGTRATQIYAGNDASINHAIQRLTKDEVL